MITMNKIERSISTLDSDVLRTFVSVAEHGNVTRAAEALHRTQSAISVQVKRMEDNLGVKLFTRKARGMSLTTAGEKLMSSAKPIIQMLDRAATELREAPIEGAVRVGIPDDYGTELLATVLADFAERHPLVEVSIRCGFSVGFPTAVERGELDLAVYASDQEETHGDVLLEEQTVWVGSANTVLHTLDPLPVTLFDRSCWWRNAAIGALDGAGIVYRIAYSSESVAGIKAAIRAGLAVGVLARSTVEQDMKILGTCEGLPPLPTSNLMLIGGSKSETPATTAMAGSIRRGFTPS
jgi:DNA-binding transcriptional LysR family regulator